MGFAFTAEKSFIDTIIFRAADDGGGGTTPVNLAFLATFSPLPLGLQQLFRNTPTTGAANSAMIELDVAIYPISGGANMPDVTVDSTALNPALNIAGPAASGTWRVKIQRTHSSIR